MIIRYFSNNQRGGFAEQPTSPNRKPSENHPAQQPNFHNLSVNSVCLVWLLIDVLKEIHCRNKPHQARH
jgi:hypothetical protein